MVALSRISLFNFLYKSISTSSNKTASLLLRIHQNVTTIKLKKNVNIISFLCNKKRKPIIKSFHILYPAQNSSFLSEELFFNNTAGVDNNSSHPKTVTKNKSDTINATTAIEHPISLKKNKSKTVLTNNSKYLSQALSLPITPCYKAPREPIVLCHGLFGFDIRGPQAIPGLQFHYWAGIEDALAKLGAKIIVTKVPQTRSIWERSHALHTILKPILANKKLNFIAYSMGGLDCRHLLATIKDRPYHAQSLTTVCTPHRGSPVMDWFRDHIGLGKTSSNILAPHQLGTPSSLKPSIAMMTQNNVTTQRHSIPLFRPTTTNTPTIAKWKKMDKLLVHCFDKPAYAHLTTDFCNNYFNPNAPDDPTVKYYSYGATASPPAWSSLLGIPWKIVYEKEGDNDGMVSINSAKWGTYVKTIQADHWDFCGKSYIPYRLRTSKTKCGQEFDRLDFYVELANHLYNQGH